MVTSEQRANQAKPREKRGGVGRYNHSSRCGAGGAGPPPTAHPWSLVTAAPVSLSRCDNHRPCEGSQTQAARGFFSGAVPKAWECSLILSVSVIAYLSHFIMSKIVDLPAPGPLRVHK